MLDSRTVGCDPASVGSTPTSLTEIIVRGSMARKLCKKIGYINQTMAVASMIRLNKVAYSGPMHTYLCVKCRKWHIGHDYIWLS